MSKPDEYNEMLFKLLGVILIVLLIIVFIEYL